MIDPAVYRSRFGPLGALGKRIVIRLFRFLLLRQAELEGRVHAVERWLPAIEGARVLAREANAGIAAVNARLTAMQQENEALRERLDALENERKT